MIVWRLEGDGRDTRHVLGDLDIRRFPINVLDGGRAAQM